MSIFSIFNTAQTGLSASKYGIDVTSNNVANKDTDGYKKRVANLSEMGQLGLSTGRGVSFDGVSRVTSQYFYDTYMKEYSKASHLNKLQDLLGSVEDLLSEKDNVGLSANLNDYFKAVEQLRTNPTSLVFKSYLQSTAQTLVENLQSAYSGIKEQQKLEETQLKEDVKEANNILKDIAEINKKIGDNPSASQSLYDKRDSLELKLSKYANVDIIRDEGAYEIKFGGVSILYNQSFLSEIELQQKNTSQVDKFNYVLNNGKVIDALKYNADGSSKESYTQNDVITYTLNNDSNLSVSLRIGETVKGNWDGDPSTPETEEVVTMDNLTRALAIKINNDPKMSQYVTAYNGDYNDDYTIYDGDNRGIDTSMDQYLRVESKNKGTDARFTGVMSVVRYEDDSQVESREVLFRNESQSKTAHTNNVIKSFEKELEFTSGSFKAQTDNLSSSSANNKIQSYLEKLDKFAATISDIYSKYIQVGEEQYVYGANSSNNYNATNMGEVVSTGLFSGSSVMSLKFDKNAVNYLNEAQINYIATIQWQNNLSFDGKFQDSEKGGTSLLDFFKNIKTDVSRDVEEAKNGFTVQAQVAQTIGDKYNNVVKVQEDEEMMNLMKLQAAYSANAKFITAADEMIQTVLGMKR